MNVASSEPGCCILILGPPGAGKTTLADAIADRLGITAIQLDRIYHRPGWTTDPADVFVENVRAALDAAPGGWVVEGNYSSVRPLLVPRATTIIWLRLPFWRTYPRVLRRTLRQVFGREHGFNGNRETIGRTLFSRHSMPVRGFLRHRQLHRAAAATVESAAPGTTVVILRTPGEVRAFLEGLAHTVPPEEETPGMLSAAL